MLLDIHALKTSILEMPTMGMENPAPPPTTYVFLPELISFKAK